jgi:hypothetical protein
MRLWRHGSMQACDLLRNSDKSSRPNRVVIYVVSGPH